MAQTDTTNGLTIGGVLGDAWDAALGTFKSWVDQEIGGTEQQLEQEAINSQAQQNAATAPATGNGGMDANLLLWLMLAAFGLVVLLAIR